MGSGSTAISNTAFGNAELGSDGCLRQIMTIPGVLGASLVDYQSGLTVAAIGRLPADDGQVTAAGVRSVVSAVIGAAPFASTGTVAHVEDIVLTAGNGYHLVHFLGPRSGSLLVLYVWSDRRGGNLAMTQRRIGILIDGSVATGPVTAGRVADGLATA
jgi:hypothetical protein